MEVSGLPYIVNTFRQMRLLIKVNRNSHSPTSLIVQESEFMEHINNL